MGENAETRVGIKMKHLFLVTHRRKQRNQSERKVFAFAFDPLSGKLQQSKQQFSSDFLGKS
jgi:hypothetical protein